jgi:hypothetical protein
MKPIHTIGLVLAVLIVGAGVYFFATPSTPSPAPQAPSEQSQGKLDINAVCEGALAYMTFPDGASAELFVEECKQGEHPEVIERYKADMNLGDGAAI